MLPNTPHIHLNYENDISTNPQMVFSQVSVFLAIEQLDSPPKSDKSNDLDLTEQLPNFDETAKGLVDTEFAWMRDA